MSSATLITFIVYFILLLAIGLYFYRKNVSIEDYLLGGRGMGAWVTALSAQASDMSGWLLMGLPGAVYLAGIGKTWIAVGLFIGTVLNWKFVSCRLRIYTERTSSITLPCFFEQRFGDPTGLLRIISAIIILLFFTIYASACLVSAGKLFESTFNVGYETAVIIGGVVIIAYTFLGGFLAVCWTDLFQGSLMLLALIIVPVAAYFQTGGYNAIRQAMSAKEISASIFPDKQQFGFLALLSTMAWGLGYFGQPHILARFMSIKSIKKLNESMTIAIVWVFISLAGAVIVGLIGIGMYDNLTGGEEEKVFIYMVKDILGPWLGGVMLAAILSAIMSTIDSQLLVSSSALTEDFYKKTIKRNASETELILVGRLCVIVISAIALILALKPNETILDIVAHAWGGFGAAFGPLVLFGLFYRKTSWQAALSGMVAGTVVLVLWKRLNWGVYMYEIVPGFVANCATLMIVTMLIPQKNEKVIQIFDEVRKISRGK
ncbi:MAG: sodium/proline symporter PutP [Planctomycetota bacterium]|jgi:sodium/proline symporter